MNRFDSPEGNMILYLARLQEKEMSSPCGPDVRLLNNGRKLNMNALKWDKEFALEQAADDRELLQELLGIFKDSMQSDVLLIQQGLDEGSAAKICGAAHSIKGAAASLGILGIKEIALAIEEESRTGGLDVARLKLPELQALLLELQTL